MMSSGLSHLRTSSSSGAELTSGVVSPQRNDPAGRCTAENISARTRSFDHPHSENDRACSGQITNSDTPPSGHQFGLQVAAAASPSTRANSDGPVLRWSEIDSGASAPTTVTTGASLANPRDTWSGSHGLT